MEGRGERKKQRGMEADSRRTKTTNNQQHTGKAGEEEGKDKLGEKEDRH